jgi:hypothetical protein
MKCPKLYETPFTRKQSFDVIFDTDNILESAELKTNINFYFLKILYLPIDGLVLIYLTFTYLVKKALKL